MAGYQHVDLELLEPPQGALEHRAIAILDRRDDARHDRIAANQQALLWHVDADAVGAVARRLDQAHDAAAEIDCELAREGHGWPGQRIRSDAVPRDEGGHVAAHHGRAGSVGVDLGALKWRTAEDVVAVAVCEDESFGAMAEGTQGGDHRLAIGQVVAGIDRDRGPPAEDDGVLALDDRLVDREAAVGDLHGA